MGGVGGPDSQPLLARASEVRREPHGDPGAGVGGVGNPTPSRSGSGFRSAARAARRPRSGSGWGRRTRLPAVLARASEVRREPHGDPGAGVGGVGGPDSQPPPGSGFRSAARAARRPRSGSGWGRGTRLPAAPGSGFRSAARAARRPRSGSGWGRGTRLPAAPGSGFRSAARAARRPRSGSGWGRGTRLPAAPGSGIATPSRASARFGEFRFVVHSCERGAGAPLSHFPPDHAGGEQGSPPSVSVVPQYVRWPCTAGNADRKSPASCCSVPAWSW